MNLQFRNLRTSLSSFELNIDANVSGNVISLFGPSGSGKTSLIDLVAGLRRPSTGSIAIDGEILTDQERNIFIPPAQRGIGYVPQEGALFPNLKVRNNLTYGVKKNPSAKRFSLSHVCDVLDLTPLLDAFPSTLSGGEKQRVALGRALLSGPRLLLLDEPFASLDEELKDKGIALLGRVREEFLIPMIYVSHSVREIMFLSDRVLILDRGRITREGVPSAGFFLETSLRADHSIPPSNNNNDMKISARNTLRGTIKNIVTGSLNAEILLDVNGTELVAQISKASAEHLDLAVGKTAYAVIKTDSIMVGVDD